MEGGTDCFLSVYLGVVSWTAVSDCSRSYLAVSGWDSLYASGPHWVSWGAVETWRLRVMNRHFQDLGVLSTLDLLSFHTSFRILWIIYTQTLIGILVRIVWPGGSAWRELVSFSAFQHVNPVWLSILFRSLIYVLRSVIFSICVLYLACFIYVYFNIFLHI